MILKSEEDVAYTRELLRQLQERVDLRSRETPIDPWLHDQTLRSYYRLIVKMKEDIVRFESRRLLQQAEKK